MRQAVVDLASQPIRNLAADPRATRLTSPTPPSQGPGFWDNRWTAYTAYSLVAGATDGPPGLGITTYARGTVKGGSAGRTGLGFHLAENTEAATPDSRWMLPVVAGQRITVTAWFRCSVAVSGALRLRFGVATPGTVPATWSTGAGTTVGPNLPMAAGAWTRFTWTATVPAGANAMGLTWRVDTGLSDGDTFDGTGLTITVGPDPGIHLDGNSTGWRWTGTAGASESVGYPFGPVRNLAAYPYPQTTITGNTPWGNNRWFGTTANGVTPAGTHSIVTAGLPVGIPRAVRKTWTVGVDPAGHVGDTGFDVNNNTGATGANGNRWPVIPGEVYTGSAFMRTNTANKITQMSFYWYDAAGVTLGTTRTNVIAATLKANVWTRVSGTVTVPAGAYGMTVKPDISVSNVAADYWQAEDWLEATGLMITAGSTLHPYMDGNAPGWQWTGAAGASVSAGYAASLAELVGTAPAGQVLSANGTATIASPAPNTDGRSLYAVVDLAAGYTPWGAFAAFGVAGVSGIMLDSSDNNDFRIRGDFPGGDTNWWAKDDESIIPGRHVVVGSIDPARGAVRLVADGRPEVSRAITSPGTPVYDRVVAKSSVGVTPVAVYGYESGHDLPIRQRVIAWLARMYGGSTPAATVAVRSTTSRQWLNTSSFAMSPPAGVSQGDLLVAVTTTDSWSINMAPPAGWTLLGEINSNGTRGGVRAWWRVAGASEPTSYTFTGDPHGWLSMTAFTGAHPTAPIMAVASQSNDTATYSLVAPSVPGAAKGMLACAYAYGGNTWTQGGTTTPPAEMTELLDLSGQLNTAQVLNVQPLTVDGDTGTKLTTLSGTARVYSALSFTIAPATY